jgi:hypothetical protein
MVTVLVPPADDPPALSEPSWRTHVLTGSGLSRRTRESLGGYAGVAAASLPPPYCCCLSVMFLVCLLLVCSEGRHDRCSYSAAITHPLILHPQHVHICKSLGHPNPSTGLYPRSRDKFKFNPSGHNCSSNNLINLFKGIDRSFELRGESRLNRFVMTNWRPGNFFYFTLKGFHHKISKKPKDAA